MIRAVGFSDSLARRPRVTDAITLGVVVIAAAFAAFDLRRPQPPATGSRLFFTTDDGLTTFPDGIDRVPPFDHDGKPAVRAYVYACAGGRPFVAYLERLTPEAASKMRAGHETGVAVANLDFVLAEGTELKPPGNGRWINRSSPEGRKLLDVHCPDGGPGTPELVLPDD